MYLLIAAVGGVFRFQQDTVVSHRKRYPHPLLRFASLQVNIQASHLGKGYLKRNRKDDDDDKKKKDGNKNDMKKRPAAAKAANDESGKDPKGLCGC